MRQMAQVGSWKGDGSRLWRDCRGEARLARRVRRTRIAIILYIYHLHLFCGRGMPRPYKALQKQG